MTFRYIEIENEEYGHACLNDDSLTRVDVEGRQYFVTDENATEAYRQIKYLDEDRVLATTVKNKDLVEKITAQYSLKQQNELRADEQEQRYNARKKQELSDRVNNSQ